jgi:hypothetical protein
MENRKQRVLFICGSMNQTTQMHQIATELENVEAAFTPHYGDKLLDLLRRLNLIEFTILGNRQISRCLDYLRKHNLTIDLRGRKGNYDLVVTCSDLVVPSNIRDKRILLVQEGMTDPENWVYSVVKRFRFLPRWLSSTAAMGISNLYDRFCVASEGYRQHFIRKGADPRKIVVTGIPNFDNCAKYLDNDFPHRHYVLVCTSDVRETYKYEDRKSFILRALKIADGRMLIFKLHPNENIRRATKEIQRYAPGALIYSTGSAEPMIANCDVLITRFSTTVYVGLALGKEVYSDFDVDELRRLLPLQNGNAARNIAAECMDLLGSAREIKPVRPHERHQRKSMIRRYAEALFMETHP